MQAGSWIVLAACTVAAVGCAPASRQGAGTGQALYVANAADDTITILDSQSGHRLGSPIRAGRAPGQIVAGPGGTLLHLSTAAERSGEVTWLRPAGLRQGGWTAQPLHVDEAARQAVAAAAGSGMAIVAYHVLAAAAIAKPSRAYRTSVCPPW